MADIQHVIVLMLENRSFDSMLGSFETSNPKFNGLKGNERNSYGARDYVVSNDLPVGGSFSIPTPDPGESYPDITEQLFSDSAARRAANPPAAAMSGFAKNYAKQPPSKDNYDPQAVMHFYAGTQLPVMHQLAAAFGVSDQWFASAPCQTWPNRFFAHTGTCLGITDNNKFFAVGQEPFRQPSIFGALEKAGKSWRVYFHDFPQSLLLEDVMPVAAAHFRGVSQFFVDAEAGVLPAYSFIEPNYFANIFTGTPPNDQHPPHDVRYGEKLIADVYNAIRTSPCWEKALLIITYDEHGGCYDHVIPPPAVSPDGQRAEYDGFAFDSYGVRVPAVIVSPWIPPGSVLQTRDWKPGGLELEPSEAGLYPFDHTSIIKTLRDIFALPDKLTARDDKAPSLMPFMSLPGPSNDGSASGVAAKYLPPSRSEMQYIGEAIPNEFVKALGFAAERLQCGLPTFERAAVGETETVARVGVRAIAQVAAFLRSGM